MEKIVIRTLTILVFAFASNESSLKRSLLYLQMGLHHGETETETALYQEKDKMGLVMELSHLVISTRIKDSNHL